LADATILFYLLCRWVLLGQVDADWREQDVADNDDRRQPPEKLTQFESQGTFLHTTKQITIFFLV